MGRTRGGGRRGRCRGAVSTARSRRRAGLLTDLDSQPEFVDTHLHLDEFEDQDQVVREAAESGVARLITMGTDLESSRRALELAARHTSVSAAVGMHPSAAGSLDLGAFENLLGDPRVVAIGEVGLDQGPHCTVPLAEQTQRLHALCELAVAYDLPVCVHTRGTEAEALAVLSQHNRLRGVMHYFALDRDWATRFQRAGLHISFSGLLTRASRGELREVARACARDRLLLETDAPYGTPRRYSGQPNRPAWLLETARLVAELRGMPLAELASVETANARSLFTRLDSRFPC